MWDLTKCFYWSELGLSFYWLVNIYSVFSINRIKESEADLSGVHRNSLRRKERFNIGARKICSRTFSSSHKSIPLIQIVTWRWHTATPHQLFYQWVQAGVVEVPPGPNRGPSVSKDPRIQTSFSCGGLEGRSSWIEPLSTHTGWFIFIHYMNNHSARGLRSAVWLKYDIVHGFIT